MCKSTYSDANKTNSQSEIWFSGLRIKILPVQTSLGTSSLATQPWTFWSKLDSKHSD